MFVYVDVIFHSDVDRMQRNTMRPSPSVAVMTAKPPKPPCWRDFVTHSLVAESDFTDISKIARSSNDSFSSDGHPNKMAGKPKRLRAKIHRTRSQFAIEESDLPAETLTMTLAETKPDDIGLSRDTSFNEMIFQEDNNRKCQTWLQSVEACKPLEDVSCYDLSGLEGEAVSIEIPDDTHSYEQADSSTNNEINNKSVHLQKLTHKALPYEQGSGVVSSSTVIPLSLKHGTSFTEDNLINTGFPAALRSILKYVLLATVLTCTISISLLNLNVSTIHHMFSTISLSTHYNRSQSKTPYATSNTDMRTTQSTTLPGDISLTWRENRKNRFPIFILSAIGSNKKSHRHRRYVKSEVKLNGWIVWRLRNIAVKCCALLTSGFRYEFRYPNIITGRNSTKLSSAQFACPVNVSLHGVRGVTLQRVGSECPRNMTSYLRPYIPQKVDKGKSFAICLKLLYGHVNNTLLKYWIEYNREIGVDRIFMFTYNISNSNTELLKKYIRMGYIEKRPFDKPRECNHSVGDKTASYYEDEHVVMLDCRQRLSGYKYMAVVDIDEFLLPRKHENVKEMMDYLMKKKPNAAGFKIKSYLFLHSKEPGFNVPLNSSDKEKYFKRTGALSGKRSRQKNIILPSRIHLKGYGTHVFRALQGYEQVEVDASVASLNHYRSCYENLIDNCTEPLTTDTYILKFVDRIRNRTSYSDEEQTTQTMRLLSP